MSLISRLEPKLGRFAVPNLTVILIVGQVFLFVAQQVSPPNGGVDILDRFRLYPASVLNGEVWRLFTFLFDPPITHLVFAFFFWYLFYLMGTTLEVIWGTFRYNIFLLIGYLASIGMALIVHFATGQNVSANNGFLYGSVFLAFARLYPDFVMYIFFILPIKIRWLALFQWLGYGLNFLVNPSWMIKGMIAASVLNYLMFFGRDIWRDMKQGHRRMRHQARAVRSPQRLVHKCAVCGVTSDDAPQTQFRYCSRCEGDLCYCPEHVHNHEHVTHRAAETASDRHT